MHLTEAKAIIQLLADGIDPVTGECLPILSTIIRALHSVVMNVKTRNFSRPKNAGNLWTTAEINKLVRMYEKRKQYQNLQSSLAEQ